MIFPNPIKQEYNIKEKVNFLFIANSKNHYYDYMNYFHTLIMFLSFSISNKIFHNKIIGLKKDDHNANYFKEVKIYFKQPLYDGEFKIIKNDKMFIKYDDIKDNIHNIYSNFENKYDELGIYFNQYIHPLYQKIKFGDQGFLDFIQIIDGYHYFRNGIKLNYQNHLPKYFNNYNDIFERYYDNDNERDKLIIEIKNNRNYYSHRFEEHGKDIAKSNNLLKLINILKMLVEILLLNEIEIEKEKIIELIKRKYKLK